MLIFLVHHSVFGYVGERFFYEVTEHDVKDLLVVVDLAAVGYVDGDNLLAQGGVLDVVLVQGLVHFSGDRVGGFDLSGDLGLEGGVVGCGSRGVVGFEGGGKQGQGQQSHQQELLDSFHRGYSVRIKLIIVWGKLEEKRYFFGGTLGVMKFI